MLRPLVIVVSLLVLGGPLAGDVLADDGDIYQLILEGRLGDARQQLSERATASTRDGNTLFYLSLLESDADEAAKLMEAALRASVATRHLEEIYFRLAQYYYLTAKNDKLETILAQYLTRWETGKYHADMLRLSILLDETVGGYESALRQCDRYLVTYTGTEDQQRGQIDKARIMIANKKSVGSSKTLRQLSRADEGEGIPAALYLLGSEAAARNRADDAVFYYNLLREGFPTAVGLDALIHKLSTVSSDDASDGTAEKLTGTYYSVKVGVFSNKNNANNHADTFKRYDRPVEVKTKTISGKEYRVVYVGRFQKYEDAVRFKLQLESAHNEVFQVVTR